MELIRTICRPTKPNKTGMETKERLFTCTVFTKHRLDLHHEILIQLLDGKLHLAPIEEPQRILDIGTGTGIWAIDCADLYPNAEVIGTDLRFDKKIIRN